jgi:transposase
MGLSGRPSTGVCQPAAKLPAVSGGRARGVAQRRLLPPERGNWNSVFKRFARWSERGVWADLHRHVAADPDLQEVLLDSPGVRAHACAAGAKKAVPRPKPWGARAAASVPKSIP